MRHVRRVATCGLALLLAGLTAAWAATKVSYLADDPYDRDLVTITSDAPLEFMVTRSQEVTGTVRVDPENVLAEPEASFELEATKLTTGLALRDQHMRGENWLNVDRYPKITFTLEQVKSPTRPTALTPHEPLELDVVGSLTLHGKTVDLPAKVTVTLLPADDDTATRLPGDLLRVAAEFDLLLSDFGIDIPAAAIRKVANRQHVVVHLFASTERLVPAP